MTILVYTLHILVMHRYSFLRLNDKQTLLVVQFIVYTLNKDYTFYYLMLQIFLFICGITRYYLPNVIVLDQRDVLFEF